MAMGVPTLEGHFPPVYRQGLRGTRKVYSACQHTFLYDSYVIAEDIEISEDMTYVFTQSAVRFRTTILKMKPANSA